MAENFVIATVSVLVLSAFGILWLRKRARQKMARTWPAVPGTIVMADVQYSAGGAQPGAGAAYYAHLQYGYAVDNKNHQARTSRRFMNKDRADEWLNRFTRASNLTVRVNPDNPEDSEVLTEDHAQAKATTA